jgi:hypothetical protein
VQRGSGEIVCTITQPRSNRNKAETTVVLSVTDGIPTATVRVEGSMPTGDYRYSSSGHYMSDASYPEFTFSAGSKKCRSWSRQRWAGSDELRQINMAWEALDEQAGLREQVVQQRAITGGVGDVDRSQTLRVQEARRLEDLTEEIARLEVVVEARREREGGIDLSEV